ncbi:hypothetical protein [Luteimonas aquatica]|uniref:hypothetical protein n=1 Tax=Luteimonas aquatica TaxID=450364 RepID=UPI001F57A74A|nr:hypothetical protein [Luteimonas aquatica]
MKMLVNILVLGAALQAAAWSTGAGQASAQSQGPLDPNHSICPEGQIEVGDPPYCIDPDNPGTGPGGPGPGGACVPPPCLPGKPCFDPCPATEPNPF